MDSLYRQALADYREKRYARAIPQLERTIRLEPGHRWAHNVLGYCRLEMGQFDGAAAALLSAPLLAFFFCFCCRGYGILYI